MKKTGTAPRVLSAAALVGCMLSIASASQAYCRTKTCDPSREDCQADENQCSTVGHPLYWANGCLSFSVNSEGSALHGISYKTASELSERAVSRWVGADCGDGTHPSLDVHSTGPALCDGVGFSQDHGNVNLVVFRDDDWGYSTDGAVLAFTTLNYNRATGEILDADIEVNSQYSNLTVGDENVQDDLESILTHEFGHLFGLSHVPDPNATMYASYRPRETLKRDLSPDDEAGICAIYPPDAKRTPCDPRPYKGFDSSCFPTAEDGCSVTGTLGTSGTPSSWGTWAALALVGVLVARRRTRRRH